MIVRYPMYIEEELNDILELISLNEELMSNDSEDESLKFNLQYLSDFKEELNKELNQSYQHYKITTFDTVIESSSAGIILSISEVTRYLSNLQETLYSLAESALGKVMKGTKISDFVYEGATVGIGNVSRGSLKVQLKPINCSQQTFHPYLKIATDKLNDLIECGSDEDLISEQATHLGSQPIFKYMKLLHGIKSDNLTVKLFDDLKPEGYETQIITPEFADDVYNAIIQAEPQEESFFDEIEGKVVVINGKKNEITISSTRDNKNKDYVISFDNERFASLVGAKYNQFVKIKVKITTKFYELEEETQQECELVRFI